MNTEITSPTNVIVCLSMALIESLRTALLYVLQNSEYPLPAVR